MMCRRPGRLRVVLLCLSVFSTSAILLEAQQPAPQQQPPTRPANPFETVPTTPTQPEAPKQQIQNVPEAKPEAKPGQPTEDIIEAIEFRGARRVRQDTLQQLIVSKR